MKKHISTIILVVILLIGASLMLYPTFSDYINSLHQSQAISAYADSVAEMDTAQYEAVWKAAQEYNAAMNRTTQNFKLSESAAEK